MFTVEAGFQLAKSSNQLYVKFTTIAKGMTPHVLRIPGKKDPEAPLKQIALQMRSWVRSSGEKISPHPDISLEWIKLYKIYTFLVKRACVHLQIIQMMEKLTLPHQKRRRHVVLRIHRCSDAQSAQSNSQVTWCICQWYGQNDCDIVSLQESLSYSPMVGDVMSCPYPLVN